MRTLARIGVLGVFLTLALAATLLSRPEPVRDRDARLAITVTPSAAAEPDPMPAPPTDLPAVVRARIRRPTAVRNATATETHTARSPC